MRIHSEKSMFVALTLTFETEPVPQQHLGTKKPACVIFVVVFLSKKASHL